MRFVLLFFVGGGFKLKNSLEARFFAILAHEVARKYPNNIVFHDTKIVIFKGPFLDTEILEKILFEKGLIAQVVIH